MRCERPAAATPASPAPATCASSRCRKLCHRSTLHMCSLSHGPGQFFGLTVVACKCKQMQRRRKSLARPHPVVIDAALVSNHSCSSGSLLPLAMLYDGLKGMQLF